MTKTNEAKNTETTMDLFYTRDEQKKFAQDLNCQGFTANELFALFTLTKSCLDGMGGKRAGDLADDTFTWVNAGDLVAAGWTKAGARGTLSSLAKKDAVVDYREDSKGCIPGEDACVEWALADSVWQGFELYWDALTAAEPTDGETIQDVMNSVLHDEAMKVDAEVREQEANYDVAIGDVVRSYDFEGNTECYVEGTVTAIGPVEKIPGGCNHYTIRVFRQVWGGKEDTHNDLVNQDVYPPTNETINAMTNEPCNGVEVVKKAAAGSKDSLTEERKSLVETGLSIVKHAAEEYEPENPIMQKAVVEIWAAYLKTKTLGQLREMKWKATRDMVGKTFQLYR